MPQKTIKAFAHVQDGQDGSASVNVYGTMDELWEEQFWLDMSEERKQQILSGHNPHDDGSIEELNIEVEEDENGNLVLVKNFGFSFDL